MRPRPLLCWPARLLLACLPCLAQQPGETPTFRTGTTLIEFTIVAMDSNGNPVTDLKQEEITITENGESREVAFFRFEGGVSDGPEPDPLPPGIFSNRPEYTPGPPRNVTAILLDALNTPLADQMTVRDQVMDYLSTVPADTRVAVYGLSNRLVVLHGFTDDLVSLRARVEDSLKGFPVFVSSDVEDLECFAGQFRVISSMGCDAKIKQFTAGGEKVASPLTLYYQRAAARRRDGTLRALEALGDHLAGIPGRKSLIWIGGGVSIVSVTGAMQIGDPHYGFESYESQIRNTAQRLASQGVAIYPVDSLALMRAAGPPKPRPQDDGVMQIMANVVSNYDPVSAMNIMADLTGGRVARLTNDLARGMKMAAADQQASYTIGFYAVDESDGDWRRLRVQVKRRGVRVTHKQGYSPKAPAEQPREWSSDDWKAAIASSLGSTAIHLDARFNPVPGAEEGTVGLLLLIPSAELLFREVEGRMSAEVQITTAEKNTGGEFELVTETTQLRLPEGQAIDMLSYTRRWKIKPGTSTVRLIVRDRFTGRHGTLDIPVKEILGEAVAAPAEAPAK